MPRKKVEPADLAAFLRRAETKVFHVPPLPEGMTALERLLALVLQGEEGTYLAADRAVKALREHFAHFNEVRVARLFEVRDALAAGRVGSPRERAEVVQEYVRRIFGLQNHLELDWLYDASSERRARLFQALGMAPRHAPFVLDLDAALLDDEVEGFPISPQLKRFLTRTGLVPVNPKEVVVRELLDPVLEGKRLYPDYLAMSVMGDLLPVNKPSRDRRAEALKRAFAKRDELSADEFAELLAEAGYVFPHRLDPGPARKTRRKKTAAKRTTSKKTAARKKTKKAATSKGGARKKSPSRKATARGASQRRSA